MHTNDDTAVDGSPRELISLYRQLDGICQNYRTALNQTKSVAHLRLATKVSRGRRYYEARMRRQDQPRRIPLGTAENPTVQKLQARRLLQALINNLEYDMALLEKTIPRYRPTDPDVVMAGLPLAYQADPAKLFTITYGTNSLSPADGSSGSPLQQIAKEQLAAHGIRLLQRTRPLHPEHLTQRTAKGPLVRSKSEVVISNSLFARNLPYLNEPLIAIGNAMLAPDFLIFSPRDVSFYLWEHLGLLAKPGYLESNLEKLRDYQTAGFTPGNNLILTSDTTDGDLDSYRIERILDLWFG